MAVAHQEVYWVGQVLLFIWVAPSDEHCTHINELKTHTCRRLDNQWLYRKIDWCEVMTSIRGEGATQVGVLAYHYNDDMHICMNLYL